MELWVFFWANIAALTVTLYFSYLNNRRKERILENNYQIHQKRTGALDYTKSFLTKDDK